MERKAIHELKPVASQFKLTTTTRKRLPWQSLERWHASRRIFNVVHFLGRTRNDNTVVRAFLYFQSMSFSNFQIEM